ncbi:MAG: response regulator transcription factor [Saprospiraceae bacterium]|nr:response regulator transcription factor [Bacteroidia bacterium]NNE14520.1 response regulator transcription factor [Saprospiraceae bacterium]NNL91480.1 response regulator transcription factor [Saprospiraceae bacterium]
MVKYKIGLVDDEVLFLNGMRALINLHDEMEVVLMASNGQELLDKLEALSSDLPDIILCDIEMPVMDGIDTMINVNKLYPDLKTIILSSHYDPVLIIKMIELGASAFMPKNETPDVFYDTILNVIKTGFYYNNFILKVIRDKMSIARKDKEGLVKLTKREKEVLLLICEQKTNKEIGETIFLSTRTVEGHRNHLLDKTNSKNTAGLIIFAIENGYYNIKPKNKKW